MPSVTTLSTRRPATVRSATAEQFAPVLRVHAGIVGDCVPDVNVDDARARIAMGQVGYDALRVLRSCGDLHARFARVLEALDVAGLVSAVERRRIVDSEMDVDDLVAGWFTGDRTPHDPRRRAARQAAIVIGNALLRTASKLVGTSSSWRGWTRSVCPCCGGAPDIALVERPGERILVCARCDAQWRATRPGCLGCDVAEPTGVARIVNPELGYTLVMCSSCGRFIKETPRRGFGAPLVERALTAELDMAAEQRGLRI
jgi:formate dehydrogenase maturation protein FdhE